jgi:hypothetical protein
VSRPYRLLGGIAVTDRQAMAFAVLHLGDPADLGARSRDRRRTLF